jgi:putative component of membrane protein insertase Oxa1/YidC/SpoIIIJ protein YidD
MIERFAVAGAITAYQRYLSPYKGFCCAHHALHRRGSCSAFAKRVVIRFGVVWLAPLLARRFKACRRAYQVLMAQSEKPTDAEQPLEIGGKTYGDCPLRPWHPFTKDFGYCGFYPCFCF